MCLGGEIGEVLGERDWYVLGKVLRGERLVCAWGERLGCAWGERLVCAWGEITGRDLGCA